MGLARDVQRRIRHLCSVRTVRQGGVLGSYWLQVQQKLCGYVVSGKVAADTVSVRSVGDSGSRHRVGRCVVSGTV